MEGLQCLQCGTPLDQDFGIVACTKCGAVMMVDMDGKLQLAEDSEPSPAQEEAPIESIDAQLSSEPMAGMESYRLPEEAASSEADADATVFHIEPNSEPTSEAPAEEPIADAPLAAEYSGEDNSWFEQNLEPNMDPSAAPSTEQAPVENPGSFSDVENFGNQEDAETGALQFDLVLRGIDRSEVRSEVLKILADPRLYLSVRDLQAQIQGGVLVISGLNAARTSLLVSRLQHLDVKIEWRQKIYEV